MLTTAAVRHVLDRLPTLRIGVVGDLFLDRYLDLDARLTEPSLETGLDAYQVAGVRSLPGAAGTILNNLAALGVGRAAVLAVIGRDGEGYELRQALDRRRIDPGFLLDAPDRFTPTYTKPLLHAPGQPPCELNRLDIKNRTPLPPDLEARVLERLPQLLAAVDALVILDQVSEPDCGVITAAVRGRLAELGAANPDRLLLADSRERLGQFRHVALKPNQRECLATAGGTDLPAAVRELARRVGRPVFCTVGADGMLLADGRLAEPPVTPVAGYAVTGPVDPVGAGDSTSAGIACAWAAGLPAAQAAAFGNLVASITVQQLGTTGTATPAQVWERWQAVKPAGEA
jgi:bifunctional ADP-heptose synthase (sugar kinase/adenylyltransferase)